MNDLITMLDSILGTYNPVMVNTTTALDVPYVIRGIFVLMLLYGVIQAFIAVIRGVFRCLR